jgi:hypothetical protein
MRLRAALLAASAFILSLVTLSGCGETKPTEVEKSDKQIMKEKMKEFDAGGKPKSK